MTNFMNFIEEVHGTQSFRVETDLGDGYVRLHVAEAEKRQAQHDIQSTEDIIIEMLRNARDAQAQHIFVALQKEGNVRSITMIDDGKGIPEQLHEKIFEPRVTSKLDSMHLDRWGVHGRGMALYSIKVNSSQCFVAQSQPSKGSAIKVVTNIDHLPERTDQSSMPELNYDKDKILHVTGARNINRTLVEFILAEQNKTVVFAGSPVEIAATLYNWGLEALSLSERVFLEQEELPTIGQNLCLAHNPKDFQERALKLGLELSERSARRILDKQIQPVEPFINKLVDKTGAKINKQTTIETEHSDKVYGLKLSESDKKSFTQSVQNAYKSLSKAYYLEESVEPKVSVVKDELVIKIPLVKSQN